MAAAPDQAVILVMIRHGPTAWNHEGRIQGRSDQPLSAEGEVAVRSWRLAEEVHGYDWVTSPLARAGRTAALLGHETARVEPALAEMHWGAWEGFILNQLRVREGDAMARLESMGLDFRPPGGESPRDVQTRLAPWLRDLGRGGRPTAAVSHKGVIRALYALATGWAIVGKPPDKLRDGHAHCFLVDIDGRPHIDRMNLPLTGATLGSVHDG